MSKVKRTYSSRSRLSLPSSSPSSSPPPTTKRKRFGEGAENEPPTKKRTTTKTSPSGTLAKSKQSGLRQLHFSIETSVLRACTICGLSYTRGAPDDESLHRAHCSRVQRGMEWGREEEREAEKAGVEEIQAAAKLKNGKKGRIICFKANVGGRIGSKVSRPLYAYSASVLLMLIDASEACDITRDDKSCPFISSAVKRNPTIIEGISVPDSITNQCAQREDSRLRHCPTNIYRHDCRCSFRNLA